MKRLFSLFWILTFLAGSFASLANADDINYSDTVRVHRGQNSYSFEAFDSDGKSCGPALSLSANIVEHDAVRAALSGHIENRAGADYILDGIGVVLAGVGGAVALSAIGIASGATALVGGAAGVSADLAGQYYFDPERFNPANEGRADDLLNSVERAEIFRNPAKHLDAVFPVKKACKTLWTLSKDLEGFTPRETIYTASVTQSKDLSEAAYAPSAAASKVDLASATSAQ